MNRLRAVSVVLLLVSTIALGAGSVAAQSAPDCSTVTYDGAGTDANPYEVSNVDQLQCIESQGPGASYEMVSDINASGTSGWNGGDGFIPVGNDTNPFAGVFDGNGNVVTGLSVTNTSRNNVGLFGNVSDGEIRNIGVEDVNVSGDQFVGGLVGSLEGDVDDSYATGNVSGRLSVGGLIGGLRGGEITESHTDVFIEDLVLKDSGRIAGLGGLVGGSFKRDEDNPRRWFRGSLRGSDVFISNSYAEGDINLSSSACCAGGFSGFVVTEDSDEVVRIEDSYATGNITGAGFLCCVGGFGGSSNARSGGQIYYNNSHATGDIETLGGLAGGFVGESYKSVTVTNSYSTGDVNAGIGERGFGCCVGGFAGYTLRGSEIRDSYSTGDVNGTGGSRGGFVGYIRGIDIENSSSTGDVNINGTYGAGGFVGDADGASNIENSSSTGDVNGTGNSIGGFGGGISSHVSQSVATGDVTAKEGNGRYRSVEGDVVGGFAGYIRGKVDKSYARGDVTGNNTVGGFVGENSGTIDEAYSVGTPTATGAGATEVGGFVAVDKTTGSTSVTSTRTQTRGAEERRSERRGFVRPELPDRAKVPPALNRSLTETTETEDSGTTTIQASGSIKNSYWDERASGTSVSDGGTGLRTDAMTGEDAPDNMDGFDFTSTWETVPDGYPVFVWQNSEPEVDGFAIDIIDTNPPVNEGETLNVEAEITNTAERDTQDVRLSLNNTANDTRIVDTKSLNLSEGESEKVTLKGVVENASGEINATISTDNDSESVSIDLLEYISGSAASDGINLIARSNLGEPIIVGVGETVAIGFPRKEDSGNVTEQPGNYNWRVHEFSEGNTSDGQLLYTDEDDLPNQPEFDKIDPKRDARATSFRPEEPGRYVIELETDVDAFSNDSVGGETVGHTAIIEVDRTGDKELLDKHSPVLKFHPDEEYYPTRLEAIFDNSYLCRERKVERDPKKAPEIKRDKVTDSANFYELSRLSEDESTSEFYLQPYPVTEKQSKETCEHSSMSLEPLIDDFKHYNPELYASPSDSPYPRTVYGTVRENVSFDPSDEPHKSDYEKAGFGIPEESSEDYTALIYVSEYVNDPKPENTRGNLLELAKEQNLVEKILDSGAKGFDELAAHTGDGSVVIVLLDDDENPEWVLAQQHLGGEFRLWEHVETTEGHPVMYIAEGAHTSFFGPITQGQNRTARDIVEGIGLPRYAYQQQYLCPKSCGDDERGDTTIAELRDVDISPDINGYVDHTTDGVGSTDDETWAQTDNVSGIDETYEIAVLDSEKGEGWTDYSGDIYTYPPKSIGTGGKIPQQGKKWNRPGEWADNITFADVAETEGASVGDSRGQINASFPNPGQLFVPRGVMVLNPRASTVPGELNITGVVLPDDTDIEDLKNPIFLSEESIIEAPPFVVGNRTPSNGVGINIINNGMQPHEFNLHLKNEDETTGVDYSFYANSIYPNNLVGADEIQLDEVLDEEEKVEGFFPTLQDIEASLAAYPTTNPSDAGEYVFDERTIAAGGISLKDEVPELPGKEVPPGKWTRRSEPDLSTLSTQTASSGQEYNTTPIAELDLDFGRGNMEYVESVTLDIEGENRVTVSSPLPSETVSEREIKFLSATSAPESKPKMRFRVPSKNETGKFDVEVSAEFVTGDVVSSTLEDYLVYEEGVDSLVELKAGTTSDRYYAGSNAEITATLLGTEPVNDATVRAEVTKPNGSTETVDLERFGEGLYTGTLRIGQNVTSGDVRGTYNATVTATVPGGVTREQDVSWEVGFNSPVDMKQTEVPSVTPGEVADAGVGITSIAGARSVEVGLSNVKHEGDRIVSTEDVIPNASHIVTQDERTEVQTEIRIPGDAEPGTYTGTIGALVTDTETPAVEEVRIEVEPEREKFDDDEDSDRVGGVGECVPSRGVSRGEEDEKCPGRRDLGRGEDENGRGGFDTGGRRDRGRSRGEGRGR